MSYISAVFSQEDNRVVVWERNNGERTVVDYPAPLYFYKDSESGTYPTIYGSKVEKVEGFKNIADFRKERKKLKDSGVRLWESDIEPDIRLLSRQYYNVPAPKLHITFYDIEVAYEKEIGFSSPANPYAPINSISIIHHWSKELVAIVVPPEPGWTEETLAAAVDIATPGVPVPSQFKTRYVICENEKELLINFLYEIEDSDVLAGWNSSMFDMPYLAQRISQILDGKEIDISVSESFNAETNKMDIKWNNDPNYTMYKGKGNSSVFKYLKKLDFDTYTRPEWRIVKARESGKFLGISFDLSGRIAADYMQLYKKYEVAEKPSYKLSSISDHVLINEDTEEPLLPKLEYEGSLADLYRNNFPFFTRYNIRDSEILNGFEEKLGYVELANQMYHMSTGLFSHVTGTLKLAEQALVNYCHEQLHQVVNDVTRPEVDRKIDGALVLLPQIGLHENFGSVDIASLYPSAIRSLNISPEKIRGQFEGCAKDASEVALCSLKLLTCNIEEQNGTLTMSALEWNTWLKSHNWAISGYGTIFDQTEPGFVPAILTEWFAKRIEYQRLGEEADKAGNHEKSAYYERLSYIYKIKLNSLYGGLTNLYFRFFDLRMGESTTATGRVILKHQCRKVAEILEGNYNVNFPLYETITDAITAGHTEEEANQIALQGPLFKGQFQSDAVLCGDTDSCYFKTYVENSEEAKTIANAVAEKVNNSFQVFMKETFLCNPGYDNLIGAVREIVSDRGIFVEKKRYILHLTDVKGKKVDKMKIMGLDTKKTTLPAEVSKQLNKFIERFLKGESWEDISVSIVEYKELLTQSPNIMNIGLPKGVKGIEEYTQKYATEGMDARLPGHVAASLHYNECLKLYNDKTSLPIVSNMKIKVFYLEGKHGKFKSIALPTDIEVVPQWFLDNFKVNTEMHIKRLVDNPLENILKAIGKRSPTKQSMTFDSIFEF